jgi:hypothetical protein
MLQIIPLQWRTMELELEMPIAIAATVRAGIRKASLELSGMCPVY